MVQSNGSSIVSSSDSILCCYVNTKETLQVARIFHPMQGASEKIVFPGQKILFETLPEALLRIYTYSRTNGVMLLQEIPCGQLQVQSSR